MMEELIKITKHEGKQAVSARELHGFLESKRDFSNWIKDRIDKYGLIEEVDFTLAKIVERGKSGAQTKIEYALTLDCAKELAMVEGNEKGRQARRYFIACEKKLQETHKTGVSYIEDTSSILELLSDVSTVKDHQTRQNIFQRIVNLKRAEHSPANNGQDPVFFEWAKSFFAPGSGHCDEFLVRADVLKDFKEKTGRKHWTSQRFIANLRIFCSYALYILNPNHLTSASNRIIQKVDGKATEMIYISTQ